MIHSSEKISGDASNKCLLYKKASLSMSKKIDISFGFGIELE